jgi:hypothetical protein
MTLTDSEIRTASKQLPSKKARRKESLLNAKFIAPPSPMRGHEVDAFFCDSVDPISPAPVNREHQ